MPTADRTAREGLAYAMLQHEYPSAAETLVPLNDQPEDVRDHWLGKADALIAAAEARAERMEAERDEADRRAEGDLAAGNEVLRAIGAFDRKVKVGKHQATNYVHLRATIVALDTAGHSDAADTLIWQVWHRVNSEARARELVRIDAVDREAAQAETARLTAEVEALRAALRDIAQEDRGGVQGIYDDGGGDDEVIQYLFRRIHARCRIARAALTRTDQPAGTDTPAAAQEGSA